MWCPQYCSCLFSVRAYHNINFGIVMVPQYLSVAAALRHAPELISGIPLNPNSTLINYFSPAAETSP